MEIRAEARPRSGWWIRTRRALRAAVLAAVGTVLVAFALAGFLLLTIASVLALRLAWVALGRALRRRAAAAAAPPPGGTPGPRLRLVSAADDAA